MINMGFVAYRGVVDEGRLLEEDGAAVAGHAVDECRHPL